MQTTKPSTRNTPRVPPDTLTLADQPAVLDEFEYMAEDEAHERCLECFSVGWHARDDEVAELRVRLERAEADADRYFRRAFDTPESIAGRLDEGAESYWREFLEAE